MMRSLALLLILLQTSLGSETPTFDTPGPVPVSEILPAALIQFSPCTIAPEAECDGLHATYRITSDSGAEEITGTQFLANRIRELRAIAALRAMNKSAEFGKALLQTGGEKIQSVGNAVKDPVGTVKTSRKARRNFSAASAPRSKVWARAKWAQPRPSKPPLAFTAKKPNSPSNSA
jgi:hypothetical protein